MNKRYSSLTGLILLFSFSISLSAYSGGSGTSSDPYQIANQADLAELMTTTADWIEGKYFILNTDIHFVEKSLWHFTGGVM